MWFDTTPSCQNTSEHVTKAAHFIPQKRFPHRPQQTQPSHCSAYRGGLLFGPILLVEIRGNTQLLINLLFFYNLGWKMSGLEFMLVGDMICKASYDTMDGNLVPEGCEDIFRYADNIVKM